MKACQLLINKQRKRRKRRGLGPTKPTVGPGLPFPTLAGQPPDHHFQRTASIPMSTSKAPLGGSIPSSLSPCPFLTFWLLFNKPLVFWRLNLQQKRPGERAAAAAWVQAWYISERHRNVFSFGSRAVKRSWHQREKHCLALLFFSLSPSSL